MTNIKYLKVSGNPEVLKALGHLIPQLTQGLSPWDLEVLEVLDNFPQKEGGSDNDIDWELPYPIQKNKTSSLETSIEGISTLKEKFLKLTFSKANSTERTNKVRSTQFVEVDGMLLIEVRMQEDMDPKQVMSFGRYLCQDVKGADYHCVPNAVLNVNGNNYAKVSQRNDVFVITLTPKGKTLTHDSLDEIGKSYPNLRRISL